MRPKPTWTAKELEVRAKLLEQFHISEDPRLPESPGPWWCSSEPTYDPVAERYVKRAEPLSPLPPTGWRSPWWRRPGILFRAWLRSWINRRP